MAVRRPHREENIFCRLRVFFRCAAFGRTQSSVSGGTLTGIGGESFDAEDPNDVRESFSEGIDIYRGNATISGSGKLIAKTVSDMMKKGLSFGLYIIQGSLFVSDSAALTAKTSRAIDISGGDLKLSGGKICSYATSDNAAISVTRNNFYSAGNPETLRSPAAKSSAWAAYICPRRRQPREWAFFRFQTAN